MSIPMFEGAAVAILRKHNGDFGFQRLYVNVGAIIMTPLTGMLIDYTSRSGAEDYR